MFPQLRQHASKHRRLDTKSALITSAVMTLVCAAVLGTSAPSLLSRPQPPQVSLVEMSEKSVVHQVAVARIGRTSATLTFEKSSPTATMLHYGNSPTTLTTTSTLTSPHWEFTDLFPDTYYYFTLDDSPMYSFKTKK